MIEVVLFQEEGFFIGLKVTGHAPDTFGKQGQNILCAAVSMLSQTIYLYLKKRSLIESEIIQKGHLEFYTKKENRSNIPFDIFLDGIQNLEGQYPTEIKLIL